MCTVRHLYDYTYDFQEEMMRRGVRLRSRFWGERGVHLVCDLGIGIRNYRQIDQLVLHFRHVTGAAISRPFSSMTCGGGVQT